MRPLLAPKLAAAKAVGALARRAGRGGGTSLPGKLLTRLEPHAIALLAARLARGTAVVSATNGKTTTAAMVAGVLERGGTRLVHNRAGANMAGGVASALAAATRRGGRELTGDLGLFEVDEFWLAPLVKALERGGTRLVHNRAGANMAGGVASALAAATRRGGRELTGDLGLFEVDEFWLAPLVEELEPRALLLGNLFRDQLDRYGELELIAERWARVVEARRGRTRLVLNADDPLVADLGRHEGDALYFGVQDDAMAHAELQHASDSKHCRRCGHLYVYEAAYLAHLGRYHCPHCGQRRPEPAVAAEAIELRGIRSAAFTLRTPAGARRIELPLPGLYNVYNALGAAALCLALGASLDDVAAGIAAVAPAFGRAETLTLRGRPTSLLLVKNPAGANEVLRTLALEPGEHDLLGILNDRTADGRDVSWVWDADWELLAARVRRMTCAGTRAAELALRMKYAGVDPARLRVVEAPEAALDAALADGEGPLYALPTYTALLELRGVLAARGETAEYWR